MLKELPRYITCYGEGSSTQSQHNTQKRVRYTVPVLRRGRNGHRCIHVLGQHGETLQSLACHLGHNFKRVDEDGHCGDSGVKRNLLLRCGASGLQTQITKAMASEGNLVDLMQFRMRYARFRSIHYGYRSENQVTTNGKGSR